MCDFAFLIAELSVQDIHDALDTPEARLGVGVISAVVGVILVFVGENNIATRTGQSRSNYRFDGLYQLDSLSGADAVETGWSRVVLGVGLILLGIFIYFIYPLLMK